MNLKNVKLIELPKILDERGNLSFLEENNHVPFNIRRSYWIYDVPGGETRGGHSYYKNQELIIALSGSFDIVVDDGQEKKIFSLNRSNIGIYIPNGIWRHMENFSTNALSFITASEDFSEKDYERNYHKFLKIKSES